MPWKHLAPNAVPTSPSNETRAGQSAALVVDVVGRWTGAVGTWLVFKIRTLDLPLKSGAAADRPSLLGYVARYDGRGTSPVVEDLFFVALAAKSDPPPARSAPSSYVELLGFLPNFSGPT